MAPIIEIQAVHKSYGAFKALNAIDLNVEEGEVVVVIGPSGSGKSTLIRCVNQLERHESGTIRVHGLDAARARDLTRIRTEAGMVFQNFNLFPHMSVLRNVALAPVRVRGLTWAEAKRAGAQASDPRRPCRADRQISEPALRRPATAGRYRARLGDGTEDPALR